MVQAQSIQKYLLLPLSRVIIRSIIKVQLFKLIVTLIFLSGFVFCFYVLDHNRCGLVPRNIVHSGLVFYLLDLAQHLITFSFGKEIVHRIFSKHSPQKLETWYTLKITFTLVEIIFFVLSAANLGSFTVCTETKVFVTAYLAVYATLHCFMLLIAGCFGEMIYSTISKLQEIAQIFLHDAVENGIDYVESLVEQKLEPLEMMLNGYNRITANNKVKIWMEDLEKNYEMLEFTKGSLRDVSSTRMLSSSIYNYSKFDLDERSKS